MKQNVTATTTPCQVPAMPNGRGRFHGGLSTGPKGREEHVFRRPPRGDPMQSGGRGLHHGTLFTFTPESNLFWGRLRSLKPPTGKLHLCSYQNSTAGAGFGISEFMCVEVVCLQIIPRSLHLHGRPRFLWVMDVVCVASSAFGVRGSSEIGGGPMGLSSA
jgi:hypothetical protein